ncbi:MAG: hypothetical protein ABI629_15405 [bacterium]
MKAYSPGLGEAPWHSELALLHLVALLLLVPVVLAWARHERRWRPVAAAGAMALLVSVVYLARVRPGDIPTDWITIIHEGLGLQSVLHLYARGVHAGMNFGYVVGAVAAGAHATLHDVVWLNLWLALVNAVLFGVLAVCIAGLRWGVVWTLVFALNPATFLAAFSELPTNLLALYFLAGVMGWLTLTDERPQPRPIRLAAFGLCAVLTLLSALTRTEVGMLGGLALAVYSAQALLGAARWEEIGQRLYDLCERLLTYLAARPGVVVGLSALGWWLAMTGVPVLLGRSESAGLYPFNASILLFFAYLPTMLLPVGASLAIAFGFVYAFRHFRQFGGLALSLLIIVRTYLAAQDQYYEMGRYLSYVLPAVFLLGLYGTRQLDEWARRWPPLWAHAARITFLAAWFTHLLPGMPEFYMRPEYRRDGGVAQLFLDRNMQREVRHLLRTVDESPQCIFVARVLGKSAHPPSVADVFMQRDLQPHYAYAVFGGPIAVPQIVPQGEATLDAVVAHFAPDAPCVRLYFGGDCNLTYADHCTDFVAGRPLIAAERFWSRPYNNMFDYGYADTEIVLATYAYR